MIRDVVTGILAGDTQNPTVQMVELAHAVNNGNDSDDDNLGNHLERVGTVFGAFSAFSRFDGDANSPEAVEARRAAQVEALDTMVDAFAGRSGAKRGDRLYSFGGALRIGPGWLLGDGGSKTPQRVLQLPIGLAMNIPVGRNSQRGLHLEANFLDLGNVARFGSSSETATDFSDLLQIGGFAGFYMNSHDMPITLGISYAYLPARGAKEVGVWAGMYIPFLSL